MKGNNRESLVVGGLVFGFGLIGFVINYIKSKNIDTRVNALKEHVDSNLVEFSNIYNEHIDFENKKAQFIFDQIDDVVEEVGSCYEHLEALGDKTKRFDEIVDEVSC